jgi:hypothetical protein
MITLCRTNQRGHERMGRHEVWRTFSSAHQVESLADGFRALESFDEHSFPPGEGIEYPNRDADIVIYLRDGALTHVNSLGHTVLLRAGEFQSVIVRRGIRYSESNGSDTNWVHCFQISLRPLKRRAQSGSAQKRFSAAQRRGTLCMVASQTGQNGSLVISQDAAIYSALLNPGTHVVHELRGGRSAWVHVVRGQVHLLDEVLESGDGVGFASERVVSLTAREESEILLVDLDEKERTLKP